MKIKREVMGTMLDIELTQEEVADAHKEFVVSWMRDALESDFGVTEFFSDWMANKAYNIYCDEEGITEYDAVRLAYDRYELG